MVQGRPYEDVAATDQAQVQQNPVAATTGAIAGNVLPFMAGGEIPIVAKALGMDASMPLLARTLASGLSGAGISGADTLARGGSPMQAAQDAGIGGAIGAVIPGAGAMVRGIGKALPKVADWTLGGAPSLARSAINVEKAGQRAVGRAFTADAAAGRMMPAALDSAATSAGQSVINLDRGGPAVRRLARVSGASPEASSMLQGATDRGAPGVDTAEFLTKLVGGSADDLAMREGLDKAARFANAPAYAKAEAHPNAASIFTPRIENLMQAPELQQAIKEAEGTGKTWAAIRNAPPPGPAPFKVAPDGSVISTPVSPPSLKFWDQVQRNLRRQMDALGPKEKTKWSDLNALRNELLGQLDTAVPPFKVARQDAAGFFGAENALDAGRQFALQPRNLPEAMKAFGAMSDVDKKAFRIGAASSVVDKLKAGNDSFAVVKQAFGNQASREFWRSVLGPAKAAQLESYVQVQAIMEESKRAITGGSHTYDLMVAGGLAGAGATGSYFAPGNNLSTAAYFLAALRGGRSLVGRKVDQAVADQVAKLLASGDKASLNKVIANSSMSPRWKAALDAIMQGISAGVRGGSNAMMQKPLQITVNGGAPAPAY
jgi:hypothetical protein